MLGFLLKIAKYCHTCLRKKTKTKTKTLQLNVMLIFVIARAEASRQPTFWRYSWDDGNAQFFCHCTFIFFTKPDIKFSTLVD